MESQNELHSSKGVDVETIGRDLRTVWAQMAEAHQGQEQEPVLRACVLNLLVYAPGDRAATEVSEIMAEVTTQHPSRIIVMLAKAGSTDLALNAWVSALCHPSAGGRRQVCCEQIMIEAQERGAPQLPSLVWPLLMPDLPVVLWWRHTLALDHWLFKQLVKTSDRVIIDSATSPDFHRGLGPLAALVKEESQWTAFSDLNWSRLTTWRSFIAGFFDGAENGPLLAHIRRVEIEYRHDPAVTRSIPGDAFLIAGWLASRLKWRLEASPQWIDEHAYEAELNSDDGPVTVRINRTPAVEAVPLGLTTVRLIIEGEPSAQCVVSTTEDGQYWHAQVEQAGAPQPAKMARRDVGREAQLISKELEILSHDKVYEQALAMAATLAAPR
jgi:glucose-6-phosphate dehydrogenase assembly protein OpcA